MKDKIIAILTLTSVFSLFVYYKINYYNKTIRNKWTSY